MRSLLNHIFLILAIFFSVENFAQTTIKGVVYDEDTKETLPFVNIFFKGTTVGTSSDLDGKYTLKSTEVTDTIIASFIGYANKKIRIKKGVSQTIDIYLSVNKVALKEVVIEAGENPAHKILRGIIANKERNNYENYSALQREAYSRIQFDLNNFDAEFKNKQSLKDLKFLFDRVDSSKYNGKAYIPIFMIETLDEEYYKKDPYLYREIRKAKKTHGVDNNSINDFLETFYQKFNIYDNFMAGFNKNFISPISSSWKSSYKYYLKDSVVNENGVKEYYIEFQRKHAQQLAFNGYMWVEDGSFGIMEMNMRIASEANINFINDIVIEKKFMKQDGFWVPKTEKLWLDLYLTEESKGFFGTRTSTYLKNVVNKPKEDSFYKEIEKETFKTIGETSYLESVREEELTEQEKFVVQMGDSIQRAPIFKKLEAIAHVLVTGYYRKGIFEYGPWPTIYSYNEVEGHRLKFEIQTSQFFSERIKFFGHGAYGFTDTRFKYGIGALYFISKVPHWQYIELKYSNDVEQPGQSQLGFKQDNLFASFLRFSPSTKLYNLEQFVGTYEYEIQQGLSIKVKGDYKKVTSLGELYFNRLDNSTNTLISTPNVFSNEVTFTTRYAPKEEYVTGTFRRMRVKLNQNPVLSLDLTLGHKSLEQSTGFYQKVKLTVEQRVRIRQYGFTEYIFEAGKLFGTIPFPFLEIHNGNEMFNMNTNAYNLMNFVEFASDQFVGLQIEHHFNGHFFNKVPLFRKLKWREVLVYKTVIGSIDRAKHDKDILLPTTTYELTDPYIETGAGIENIFKLFRVDALWRLNYLDHPGVNPFGIRVGFKILW